MTVSELIKELEKFENKDAVVMVPKLHGNLGVDDGKGVSGYSEALSVIPFSYFGEFYIDSMPF